MERDTYNGLTGENSRENSCRIKETVMESTLGRTPGSTEETGKWVSSMDMDTSKMLMKLEKERANGKKARESNGSRRTPLQACRPCSEGG